MLTTAELQTMQTAVAAAEAEVRRLEAAADAEPWTPWGWLFPSEARRAAGAARATFDAIINVRNHAIEAGDHELAMQVTENARQLARPGMVADAIRRPDVIEKIRNPLDLFGWMLGKLKPLVTIVVVLVVLGVVAFFVAQVRTLVPARR